MNPFNGIESYQYSDPIPQARHIRNPFNGIESEVVGCRSPKGDHVVNPFNGIERDGRVSLLGYCT